MPDTLDWAKLWTSFGLQNFWRRPSGPWQGWGWRSSERPLPPLGLCLFRALFPTMIAGCNMAPAIAASFTSHPHAVPDTVRAWALWPTENGRRDGMSLSRLGCKDMVVFVLLGHGQPCEEAHVGRDQRPWRAATGGNLFTTRSSSPAQPSDAYSPGPNRGRNPRTRPAPELLGQAASGFLNL